MMHPHDTAPFSIAVALPTYRKSLVERMLSSLRQQARGLSWQLVDSADADVVLRATTDAPNDISPGLVADVRRNDGSVEAISIDTPWRSGALLAALHDMARLLGAVTAPVDPRAFDAIAWQWLRQWCDLAASDARAVELRAGERRLALLDPRSSVWRRYDGGAGDATELLAALARSGYTLAATQTVPPMMGAAPLKPLLWRLGMLAGSQGPLPALAARGALRLKGWPYLAAGGPKSHAALIAQLRDGTHDHASLRALAIAPPVELYGFLNACHVCDFFHDDTTAALPPPVAKPPPQIARPAGAPDATGALIASIRRSLGAPRS